MLADEQRPGKFYFEFWLPPLFLRKIFPHGNEKKEQRFVLVAVLYLNSRFDFYHCHKLALAYAGHAFCVYLLCVGDGYCLNRCL
jgi:uncharacterized protein YdiU (UPF0061 family)